MPSTELPTLLSAGPYAISPEQVPIVEDHYSAYYIGTSSIPNAKDGSLEKGWSYNPLDLFWTAESHPVSGEHTMALFLRDGKRFVRAANHFNCIVGGVFIPASNLVLYSTYRHDFFCPPEGGPRVCVDGGRDYTRILGEPSDYENVTINLTTRRFWNKEGEKRQYVIPFSGHNP